MKKILSIALIFYCISSFAQVEIDKLEWINSGEIIQEVFASDSDMDYEEMLSELRRIPENDTNYTAVQAEISSILLQLERYDELIEFTNKELSEKHEYNYVFYNHAALAEHRRGNHTEAIELLKKGVKEYPDYHIFYVNIGVFLEALEQYQEAVDYYKKTIQLNPKYALAHLKLGVLTAREAKFTESILALSTYILLEPNGDYSNNALSLLNQLVGNTPDFSEREGLIFSNQGDDFQELELILQNRVALNKKYKVKTKLDFPLVKQCHVLLDQLKDNEDKKGFFTEMYVSLYQKIIEDDQFKGFTLALAQASANKKHQSIVKKNEQEILSFYKWLANSMIETVLLVEEDFGEGEKAYNRWFNSENTLTAIGNAGGGLWQYFDETGKLTAKGIFDESQKKQGKWFWYYPSGSVKESYEFTDGIVNGSGLIYYKSGVLKDSSHYVNGSLEGISTEYNPEGILTAKLTYDNGKLNGKSYYYYESGDLSHEIEYSEGRKNGSYTKFYWDGTKILHCNYQEGKLEGVYKEYYYNGELQYEGDYREGELNGKYISYYLNGQIRYKGESIKGNAIGEYVSYYEDGKIKAQYNLDENGKLSGSKKEFHRDGSLLREYEYKKGDLHAYKNFDLKGEQLIVETEKKGVLNFKKQLYDGTVLSEGKYLKRKLSGEWLYYNDYGVLEIKKNFLDGNLNGVYEVYYLDGSLHKTMNYEDGKLEGYYQSFHKNGALHERGYYKSDELDGVWESYFEDGALDSRMYFIEGKEHGKSYYYSSKGTLSSIGYYDQGVYLNSVFMDTLGVPYKDMELELGYGSADLPFMYKEHKFREGKLLKGVREGTFNWYHLNGKLGTSGNYKNGKKVGEWKWYNSEGKLTSIEKYVGGMIQGIAENYDSETGSVVQVKTYDQGELHGERIYYSSENPELITFRDNYFQGKRHGKIYSYSPNSGSLKYERDYSYGKLKSYSYYDKDGNFVKEVPIENGNVEIRAFYKNGKPSIQSNYVKGKLHGKFQEYYDNGNLEEITEFYYGDYNGERKNYYSNGQLESEYSYAYDKLIGPYKEYYKNGKLKLIGYYYNDERHGDFKYYDESGKLTRVLSYHHGDRINETITE